MNWFVKIFNIGLALCILFIVLSNFWIIKTTQDKVIDSTDDLPNVETAIVFGTSKSKVGGGSNPFFDNRMKAAAELYHSGKVKKLILSGSKELKYYNEPDDMSLALKKLGVDSKNMILDTLGVRTLDTIIRSKEIYKTNSAILVTQEYHAFRAIYIAKSIELDVVCFSADFPSDNYFFKTKVREVLARTKAVIEVFFVS